MSGLLPLLFEFYQEKLTSLLQHQAGAQLVSQYDVNNTYQYIVNREDVQLSWLADVIAGLGGTLPAVPAAPERHAPGKGEARSRAILEEDARGAAAFVERWRPRVEAMTNARHRLMLGVILGETLEQQRFFEQALAGRTDLLGRRGSQLPAASGDVLPDRWIE